MSRKRIKGATDEKLRATIVLCELARQEAGGKVSLLGVFTGEEIRVLGGGSGEPPPGVLAALDDFAIVATFFGGQGVSDLSFRLVSPGGQVVLEGGLGTADFNKSQSVTAVVAARPFFVSAFGTYECVFRLGALEHVFAFAISDYRRSEVGKDR